MNTVEQRGPLYTYIICFKLTNTLAHFIQLHGELRYAVEQSNLFCDSVEQWSTLHSLTEGSTLQSLTEWPTLRI